MSDSPSKTDTLFAEAKAHHEAGRFDEAIAGYQAILTEDPKSYQAHNNLGTLFENLGKWVHAEACYRAGLDCSREALILYNLGHVLQRQDRFEEAIEAYKESLDMIPTTDAYFNLVQAQMSLKQTNEALATVQKWVSVDKEHPQAQHLLAILGGDPNYKRASNGYIEDYFDGFAEGFEHTLTQLRYQVPKHVGELLAKLELPPNTRALDLGCGTGLSGSAMQPYCEVLHGIDLSAGMLRLAKEKDIYQKLFKAELTDFLFTVIEPYNLIVSADTLCYFGDLEPVLKNAHRALTVPGDLVFSVEKGEAGTPYKLQSSGRFAHSESYVRETLAQSGFQPPTVSSVKMRDDGTEPIFGYLFHSRRI